MAPDWLSFGCFVTSSTPLVQLRCLSLCDAIPAEVLLAGTKQRPGVDKCCQEVPDRTTGQQRCQHQ